MTTNIATVIIESADVLTLGATPVQLVPSEWVGKVILVDKIVWAIDFNSAAYETNVDLKFKYDLGLPADALWSEVTLVVMDSLLLATVDEFYVVSGRWDTETQLFENQWISVEVVAWDPTTWDSDITLTVYYKVITL